MRVEKCLCNVVMGLLLYVQMSLNVHALQHGMLRRPSEKLIEQSEWMNVREGNHTVHCRSLLSARV